VRRQAHGSGEPSDKVISRALGEELRRAREALGWSRLELVARLPSGIGDRTLLSYEHGTRNLTMIRFIEICRAMGVDSATLHSRALQRARIHVETMNLHVDLYELLRDTNDKFRPMVQWARNTLNEHPDGLVEVQPGVVRNLARFAGCSYLDLANYLAQFVPDYSGADEREGNR
jgi:transcriptional regulator with XRE-family HTH domain